MAKYYAYVSGPANIYTNFNPYQTYTGNSNYLRLEYNGDITTNSTTNVYVWRQQNGNWFSFEQGAFKQYMNLGNTTYVTNVNTTPANEMYWNTSGFSTTAVFTLSGGNATLTMGGVTKTGTFSGSFPDNTTIFFPNTLSSNLRMNFYELKVYGRNDTLLYDFVPYLSGSTKGILEKVSGHFYNPSNSSYLALYSLSSFEVSETALTNDYNSTAFTVNLTADENTTWSATTIPSWVTVSPSTGSSTSATLTITFAKNTSYSQRTGTIVFTDSEDNTCEIECTQGKHPLLLPKNNIYRGGLLVN